MTDVEGKSSKFVLEHIRASQSEFRAEIEAAGFVAIPAAEGPKLKENFLAKFRKVEPKDRPVRARTGRITRE